MRRVLAGWIVVALAAGVVVAARGDRPAVPTRYLPAVLPLGYTLSEADVAQAGTTLATPTSYARVVLRRPGDRVYADYLAAPADPNGTGGSRRFRLGQRQPFGDGVAFVHHEWGTAVWWSTSRRSGTLSSSTVGAEELLAMARRFDRSGFATPPGWKGIAAFDPDSAVEVLRYHAPGTSDLLQVFVHAARAPVPVSLQVAGVVQRQLGHAVVTVHSSELEARDLRAIVASVRPVGAEAWRAATSAAELDDRAVRWDELASGRTSTNAGWSLAVEDRDGRRCLALLVAEGLGGEATCHVASWRTDPVLAVSTDRSGPLVVTANGRALRAQGEARFEGRRILVVELPAELWGQVIDPVAVVSRRS